MEAGEILIKRGVVTPQELERLRHVQPEGARIDQAGIQLGLLDEQEVLAALGAELNLELVDLSQIEPDLSLLEGFPVKLLHRHTLFPIARRQGTLVMATSDPLDLYALDEVAATVGVTVEPVLAARGEVLRLLKTHLGMGAETIDGLMQLRGESGDEAIELLEGLELDGSEDCQQAQEASVVRLVNEILTEAIEARASDIHIEAQARGMRIRYRLDGILQTQPAPVEMHRFQAAIFSRLKIMSRLNIAEKRLPQDGRIKLKVAGREVDIRLSLIPMIHGEGAVMRILDKDRMTFSLEGAGLEGSIGSKFRELISLPHGIVLVTGPTGSGKTTTLYAALNEIRDDSTKIITTEDPVEYQLEGISQIQVQHKIGLSFAASLRSILRHDPDVILVGEIRDLETAENAVQASLTGHMVFSTLHTNDAAGAFMRLCDMGVEPFLVASTLEGVMAQRLVRTLCRECRGEYQPSREDLPEDFPWERLTLPLMRAVGCRACRGTGYRGRAGLFELLVADDEIRQLAHERASSREIKKAAVRAGMVTLRHDGWQKVLDGRTTVDEVLRVSKKD